MVYKMKAKHCAFFILFTSLLASCRVYKQDLMFQLSESDVEALARLEKENHKIEENYTIQPGDWLKLEVNTNGGERLIDPNFEFFGDRGNMMMQQQRMEKPLYLVYDDGIAKLPMVGNIHLAGMRMIDAEKILHEMYDEFYSDCFVLLRYMNKRVVVLGAMGGHVVPLENENTSLLEVLALSGGLNRESRAHNIRVIRGDLSDPKVYQIDLSTLAGMKASNMAVFPGDIVYVEPGRRIWVESVRDFSPIISTITGILTLAVLVITLTAE
jgi:polysaccharide biosynthesis/export protein